MKRGFLKDTYKEAQREPDTNRQSTATPVKPLILIPIARVAPRINVPSIPTFPSSFDFLLVRLPPYNPLNAFEPMATCLLFPGAKERMLARPGFPPPPFIHPTSLPYRISDISGVGKGMFARVDIEPGQLVLAERPVCMFPQAMPYAEGKSQHPNDVLEIVLNNMPPAPRELFYKLHNCKGPDVPEVQGILDTNSLSIDPFPGEYSGHYAGVCLELSRINHSCTPNTHHRWDAKAFVYEVRALRRIKKGEEISITYLDVFHSRAGRQQHLKDDYAFACACPSCGLSAAESAQSDIRRSLLSTAAQESDSPPAETALKAWIADRSLPDDHVIKYSQRIVDMMAQEGLYHADIWQIHYPRLCKAYCALGNREEAVDWARKTALMFMAHTGKDEGWSKVAEAPECTDWWEVRVDSPK